MWSTYGVEQLVVVSGHFGDVIAVVRRALVASVDGGIVFDHLLR